MDENLVEYQQMLKAADAQMAKEIEDMSKGKYVRIKHGSPSFTNQRLTAISFRYTSFAKCQPTEFKVT